MSVRPAIGLLLAVALLVAPLPGGPICATQPAAPAPCCCPPAEGGGSSCGPTGCCCLSDGQPAAPVSPLPVPSTPTSAHDLALAPPVVIAAIIPPPPVPAADRDAAEPGAHAPSPRFLLVCTFRC